MPLTPIIINRHWFEAGTTAVWYNQVSIVQLPLERVKAPLDGAVNLLPLKYIP